MHGHDLQSVIEGVVHVWNAAVVESRDKQEHAGDVAFPKALQRNAVCIEDSDSWAVATCWLTVCKKKEFAALVRGYCANGCMDCCLHVLYECLMSMHQHHVDCNRDTAQ